MSPSRVAYVELAVPDLQRSVDHAVGILGLREVERIGESVYLTCNERHHELVLTASDAPSLAAVALEVADARELDGLTDALSDAGLAPETHDVPGVAEARRFVAPGGLTVDLVRGMAADEPARFASPAPTPRKFGHATLTSDVPDELEAVLTGPLGFRLSDTVPGVLSWYRCSADHHGVAIAPAPVTGLHHYAFELDGWASMQAFADHLTLNDVLLIWGPGRHGPGRNLFAYHLDPAGGVVEVLADLQRIESEETYVPRTWPMTPQTLNQWGPPPPEDFLEHAMPCRPSVPAG